MQIKGRFITVHRLHWTCNINRTLDTLDMKFCFTICAYVSVHSIPMPH